MTYAARALRHARRLVESGQLEFICCALDDAEQEYPELASACADLQKQIHQDIEPSFTLGQWLARQHGTWPTTSHQQLARLAWIDKLILENS